MRIVLLSAAPDRHARQLEKAFAALGCDCRRFETAEIGFDTGAAHGIVMPWLGEALPDAVCLRTMSGGSFEAITRRLAILHALSSLGVVVSNDARTVERCTDKSMTSFRLARAGLPSPRSHAVETRGQALAILASAPGPLVLKPLFGAQERASGWWRRRTTCPNPPMSAACIIFRNLSAIGVPGHGATIASWYRGAWRWAP